MNDAQLLRYSRHILLDEIGIDGQESRQAVLREPELSAGCGITDGDGTFYLKHGRSFEFAE